MAVLLTSFSDIILFIILLILYRKDLMKEFGIYKKHLKKCLDTGFACWVVGFIIMVVSNSIIIQVFHASGANNETVVREMIHVFPLFMGLNVCLLAPVIEEIVFRKTLKDVIKNPAILIVASFLLFGIAHVSSMATSFVDWLYVIPYGALGGAFALAYYKTDSVFTSITFHMLHNIFVFLIVLII